MDQWASKAATNQVFEGRFVLAVNGIGPLRVENKMESTHGSTSYACRWAQAKGM